MAELCGLSTLLFWTGIIVLAGCQETTSDPTRHLCDSTEIQQSPSTGLPASIEPKLPKIPECGDVSVSYTCSRTDKPGEENKLELSELEPFTEYSCTGLILNNNVSTDKTTPPVHLNTDCDLTVNVGTEKDKTSIKLNWKTTSNNCNSVLHTLHSLLYDCSCSPNGKTSTTKLQPDGGTCEITGLKPFTGYKCSIQPKYNGRTVSSKKEVGVKTEPGVPAGSPTVKPTVTENNVIKVECEYSSSINGPDKIYIARLHAGGEKKQQKNKNCKFEFKDLSYSTNYTVEVTVSNGYFESKPGKSSAHTRYYDKAVIRLVVFLIFAVLVVFVFYRMFRECSSLYEHTTSWMAS